MIAKPTVRMINRHDEPYEPVAPEGEAGVVEGRDRVEDAAPKRRPEAEVVGEPKPRRRHGRDERLEDGREDDDEFLRARRS